MNSPEIGLDEKSARETQQGLFLEKTSPTISMVLIYTLNSFCDYVIAMLERLRMILPGLGQWTDHRILCLSYEENTWMLLYSKEDPFERA